MAYSPRQQPPQPSQPSRDSSPPSTSSSPRSTGSVPLMVRVRDGVGVLGLLLITLGLAARTWRLLTGVEAASTGQQLMALLFTLGLGGVTAYLAYRMLSSGPGDWVRMPAPPRAGLAPLELHERRRLNSTEWFLLPVLLLTMGGGLIVAIAWSLAGIGGLSLLLWLLVAVWWLIGGFLLHSMYRRVRGPQHRGPVLRIEERGIIDLRPPMQGFVPWDEIRYVEGLLVRSTPRLVVTFEPGAPSRERVASQALNWLDLYPGDWFIDLSDLDANLTEVDHHARQCLVLWRQRAGRSA